MKLVCLLLCIYYANAQVTFGTLSSSAFRSTLTTTTTPRVTISTGTLSTGAFTTTTPVSTVTGALTTTTTTASSAVACPAGFTYCQNGGACVILNGRDIICNCKPGFIGEQCQTALTTATTSITTVTTPSTTTTANSECPAVEKQKCKNGASCIYIENSFAFCVCTDNFIGIDCSVPVITAPATTTTTTASSAVACPAGLTYCQNGGACVILNGKDIICNCKPGFIGDQCQTVLGTTTTTTVATTVGSSVPCPTGINFCQNGGDCRILNGKEIVCNCKPGFAGVECEIPIGSITTTTTTTAAPTSDCPVNICQNGGKCNIIKNTDLVCTCPAGFSGLLCQNEAPFCESNPCKNGGQCVQTEAVKGVCLCFNYYGQFCETQSCSPNPCQNDQTCILGADNKPKCLCAATFTGSYCEKRV